MTNNVEILGVNPSLENQIRDRQQRDLLVLSRPGDRYGAGVGRGSNMRLGKIVRGDWEVECQAAVKIDDPEKAIEIFGRYGVSFRQPPQVLAHNALQKLLGHLRNPDILALEKILSGGGRNWIEKYHNIVVNQGLDHLLDATLAAQTQITSWYVGLKGSGTPAAADIPSSHVTWSEDTTYSESVRQTWTPNGAASSQSVTNSSARATFSINGTTTIYGAFLISNSTKGGTTGKFYAVGNFGSSRAVISGDSLLVTATFTSADDGV